MKHIQKYIKWLSHNALLTTIVAWYAFMWSWLLFTDTLDLAGNSKQGLFIAVIVLLINVSISCAIIWQAFRAAKWILAKYGALGILFILPIFALADWLVAWVPSILWVGPQALLNSNLPLATPTLLVINTPLAFASRFVGFFGLASFFWTIIALLREKKYRKKSLVLFIILAVLSTLGWLAYKTPNGTTVKTTIISESLDNHVPKIEGNGAELVIFPEYGLDGISQENYDTRIKKADSEDSKVFFLGSQELLPSNPNKAGHYNTLLYGNNFDGITNIQDKYRLIPGGEDLAYFVRIALRATNQKETLNYFSYAKGVIRGKYQLNTMHINDDVVVGAAVCSSIIAPQDYQEFAKNGATIFSNSASLTIFKNSPLFKWQQKSFAKFMAISNSRFFLQSANSATAYALDNNGHTLKEISGVQTADISAHTNTTKTPYTYVGDWLPAIGALMASWLIYKNLLKPKVKKR